VKKLFIIPVAIILICAFIITGCQTTTTTTPAAPTTSAPAASSPATSKPATSAPSTAQPVVGGTLRIIAATGPQVLGGFEGGPADAYYAFPAVEALLDATADRTQGNGLEPVLAQSYTEDVAGKKFIFNLRKGIKFSDGSDFNADVVLWNYQQTIDAGRLQYADKWAGMKKIDDYTVEVDFKEYTNQLIQSWGWAGQRSMKAYMDATGGDAAKGVIWNRTHVVGTGPFILTEFVRDDHLTWKKNPNYWRPGKPYLDGISYKFVPDPVTAQALMQSGQADYWRLPPQQNQISLVNAGFQRFTSWTGLPYAIWPNTNDPNSKWNDLRLRQALDYAIDKKAIAQAMGKGYYLPMNQVAPQGEWGYDPNYAGRDYNVAKAKSLLADAGYPNGLKANLLILNDAESQDAGAAIKQYLDAAGIQTNLDVADPGRFYASVWGKNVPTGDLSFTFYGKDITYLLTYMRWFSSDPFTFLSYMGRPAEQVALDNEAKVIPDAAGQKAETVKLMKWMTDNARVLPLYEVPSAIIGAKYVHTTEFKTGFVRWITEDVWMDKH
jgi:peptide/nickel transport system substrate-binding protein